MTKFGIINWLILGCLGHLSSTRICARDCTTLRAPNNKSRHFACWTVQYYAPSPSFNPYDWESIIQGCHWLYIVRTYSSSPFHPKKVLDHLLVILIQQVIEFVFSLKKYSYVWLLRIYYRKNEDQKFWWSNLIRAEIIPLKNTLEKRFRSEIIFPKLFSCRENLELKTHVNVSIGSLS